jgi:hypothetical protein
MIPVHQDPWFTFRFADDRIIPRFHLEGIEAGRKISVFKVDPGTGERPEAGKCELALSLHWTTRVFNADRSGFGDTLIE